MPLTPYQRRQMSMRKRSGFTAAQEAAREGNEALVLDYLDAGYPPAQLWEGALAGRWRTPSLPGRLLDHGVPADQLMKDGRTALMVVAKDGDLALFERLVQAGANLNTVSINQESPLSEAALGRQEAIVQRLLELGASPNPEDPQFPAHTALHWAIAYGFERGGLGHTVVPTVREAGRRIALRLLDAGADCNRENPKGLTPFAMVLRSAEDHAMVTPMLDAMLAHGADINHVGPEGSAHGSPLGDTMTYYFQKERFEWLLAQRPDLDLATDTGRSPLLNALQRSSSFRDENQLYCVRRLLEEGANPHARMGDGETPFETFLGLWADRGEVDPKGGNLFRDEGLWQAMVNHPAFDPNAQAPTGKTLLVHLLHHAHWGPEHLRLVQRLLALGTDPDLPDSYGQTPLVIACAKSWATHQKQDAVDLVHALLNAGADPALGRHWSAFDPHTTGYSLLHLSAKQQHLSAIVQRLVDLGLSPNVTDVHGNTPLHIAVRNGATDSATILMKHGARPDVDNLDGEKPFEVVSPNLSEDAPIHQVVMALRSLYEQGELRSTLDQAPGAAAVAATARGRHRL